MRTGRAIKCSWLLAVSACAAPPTPATPTASTKVPVTACLVSAPAPAEEALVAVEEGDVLVAAVGSQPEDVELQATILEGTPKTAACTPFEPSPTRFQARQDLVPGAAKNVQEPKGTADFGVYSPEKKERETVHASLAGSCGRVAVYESTATKVPLTTAEARTLACSVDAMIPLIEHHVRPLPDADGDGYVDVLVDDAVRAIHGDSQEVYFDDCVLGTTCGAPSEKVQAWGLGALGAGTRRAYYVNDFLPRSIARELVHLAQLEIVRAAGAKLSALILPPHYRQGFAEFLRAGYGVGSEDYRQSVSEALRSPTLRLADAQVFGGLFAWRLYERFGPSIGAKLVTNYIWRATPPPPPFDEAQELSVFCTELARDPRHVPRSLGSGAAWPWESVPVTALTSRRHLFAGSCTALRASHAGTLRLRWTLPPPRFTLVRSKP